MTALDNTSAHHDAPQHTADNTHAAGLSHEAQGLHQSLAGGGHGPKEAGGEQKALDSGMGKGTQALYDGQGGAKAGGGKADGSEGGHAPISDKQVNTINNGLANTASIYGDSGKSGRNGSDAAAAPAAASGGDGRRPPSSVAGADDGNNHRPSSGGADGSFSPSGAGTGGPDGGGHGKAGSGGGDGAPPRSLGAATGGADGGHPYNRHGQTSDSSSLAAPGGEGALNAHGNPGGASSLDGSAGDTNFAPSNANNFAPGANAGDAAARAGGGDAASGDAAHANDARKTAAQADATRILDKAAAAEPQVTSDMQALADKNGGQMAGLENRLKSQDSLERKIEDGTPADKVSDALRYTMTFDQSKLTDGANSVMSGMEQQGYKNEKVANSFPKDGAAYKGLNTSWSKDGQTFELQFHTPQSLDVKGNQNHGLYEARREMFQKDPSSPGAEVMKPASELAAVAQKHEDTLSKYPGVSDLGKQLSQYKGDEEGGKALASRLADALDQQQIDNSAKIVQPDKIGEIKSGKRKFDSGNEA